MAYSRNEYLQSLNRMRANYQSQGNPLINTEDDNGNVGNELSSFAYMNTEQPAPEQTSESKPNAWKRTADTITGSSFRTNFTHGVMNFVDDVADFVVTAGNEVGKFFRGLGNWFSGKSWDEGFDDMNRTTQEIVSYDWQAHVENFLYQVDIYSRLWDGSVFTEDYWNSWGDTFTDTKKSRENVTMAEQSGWENELGWVGKVEQGIGYVLPSLVAGFFTGGSSLGVQVGVQAGIAGTTGFGAGFEQATAEGADYGEALGYGATKGAISAGTTAVMMGIGGSVASKAGSGIGGKILDKTVDKTGSVLVGKLAEAGFKATTSAGRSALITAVEPVIKQITYDGDAIEKAYGSSEAIKNTLKTIGENAMQSAIISASISAIQTGAGIIKAGGKSNYEQQYFNQRAIREANIQKELKTLNDYNKSVEKLQKDLLNGKITQKQFVSQVKDLNAQHGQALQSLNEKYSAWEKRNGIDNKIGNVKNAEMRQIAKDNLGNMTREVFMKSPEVAIAKVAKANGMSNDQAKDLLVKMGFFKGTGNKDIKVNADTGKMYVTVRNNGNDFQAPLQIAGGGTPKISPTSGSEIYGSINVIASSNFASKNLPSTIEIKPSVLNVPDVQIGTLNNSYKLTKDVSSKILNKSNSREIMNFLENGLQGKGKENFVMKATNGEKYIVVEPYKDGETQKYGIITINSKTNEILDITVKSERPSVDRAYIVPKIDEQKLLTTKLENPDGTAIVYDVKNVEDDWDVSGRELEFSINAKPTFNRAVNEGGFIYSKNPLRVADFKKEIPFARLAKTFNIPTSLEKTYKLKLRDPKNELSVLKWVGKRSGLSVKQVLEKLGYDSIVKSDNSVTFFSAGNILHRGVEYKHGKRSENYSDLIKRNVSEDTRQKLEGYVGANGKELITQKDGFEYSQLIRETLSYSPQEISYGGEKYEVKIIDPKKYTPDMLRVIDKGKKIGVRTRFALRMQEAEHDEALSGVSAYWAEGGKDIVVFVDSGRRGTLEQTATHELGHAIFDKLHGWTLLDIQSKIEYLEKNHPTELLKKKELYCEQWDYDPNQIEYDNMIYEEMFADTFAGFCKWEDKEFQNNLIKEMTDLYEKGSKWANKQYYKVLANEETEYLGYNYTERAEIAKGADDGFRKLQEESRREFETKSWEERSGALDEELRRRLSNIFGKELKRRGYGNGNDTRLLKVGDFKIFKNVDGQTFHDIFEIARTYLPNGELVDLHDVETTEEHGVGYKYTRNYLSKDGMSGFAITKEGDLISVFNAGSKRGWLRSIQPIIAKKAKTLDCYASDKQNLPEMYSKLLGFKTASLMDWNSEYDHDNIGAVHGEPKVAFMVKTDAEVTLRTFGKDDYDGAVAYRNSLVPEQVSTNRPNEREIIKSNANLKHEKVYSLKTTNQIVDNALVNMLNKWSNAVKITIPTGKTKLKEFTFEELNLYKDKDKAIENIVNEIESAIVTFDNGTNGHQKIALKDLGMHEDLTKAVRGLVAHHGELSEKSKWVRHYIDTLHRYAGYVHEQALLRSEYVTANKAQKTLDNIFEDTRTMKIGGDTVVNEITLYKQLTSNLLLSKSAKNVAPSTFTKLVNNFNNYTAENYADYFDVALKDLVDELALSFEDGKFPNREPTLNEMQLFNAIRGRIIARCRVLISEKHQLKIKNNELGTKLASVALPAIEPKRYGKVKNILDSAISFPVKIRSDLGTNHPFVKLFTETYLRVSANAISKANEFRTYNFKTLAKEAGYAKRGALLKDLKKNIVEIKDRSGRVYKKTVDDIIGAYWIYKTAQEQLLATGLTAYNDKNKTDVDFKIDDELYQDMFDKLPENARKWADLVYEKYFNGMDYEYKMSIIKEFFGDLNFLSARKGTYAPTNRVGQVNMGVGATSQFDAGYLSTMYKGFLKPRAKNKNHFRWLSASDTLEYNMQQVATWGEKSQWVDDVRTALNTTIPGVGNHTLEYYLDKHVPEWKQVWSPYMSKIILGKQILEKKHGLLEFLGNVGQVSTLGGNIGSILRQTLSDFSWTFDDRVTWRTWLSTIPQAVSNFFKMGSIKKELMENNGYFIERFNQGEVIKAIMNGKLPFKIGQIVLKPMEWLDSVVVSTHGYALAKRIVNDGVKKGYYDFAKGSPEYKREVAHVLQGMTLISQSNADPMFLSRLRSGDAGWINREVFGRFASDNQNKYQALQKITREKINSDKRRKAYEEASKDDKYSEEEKEAFRQASEQEVKDFKKNYGKKIAGFAVAIILNSLGAYVITHFVRKIKGKEEWDEFGKPEEVIRDIFLESTVNWVPYISTIANAIENNSDVSAFTVDKLNNLVDMVKLVEIAFEKGDETSIKRAIWSLVTNGLELTGIPANNIYQLFMGIWYQFDKEGSLSAQSWVKGYKSSYMKSQYTSAITSGNTARAKAQLGAWSSMYSTNITDEATLNELVRLSMAGYNATPSANATSYTNDKGDKVSFTSTQANAFKAEYAKSNKAVSKLLKIEDYKKQDDKTKANLINKIYNAYRESAQAKALGIAPNSKLAQLIYYSSGDVNLAKYIMSMQNLSVIKGDEKQTRKEKVIAEINKLRGFSKNEKLLLAYLSGYSVSEKNINRMLQFLVSNGFSKKDAKAYLGIK